MLRACRVVVNRVEKHARREGHCEAAASLSIFEPRCGNVGRQYEDFADTVRTAVPSPSAASNHGRCDRRRNAMRIALIHNPHAGNGHTPDLGQLLSLLRAHGHEVRYRSSKDGHLGNFLAKSADVVVAAGGDGTIAKVAKLMRRHRTPIAPLPLGTANNICTALGLTDLSLGEQIAGWATAPLLRFDIGKASGPWGLRRFVESFGIGVIPRMIGNGSQQPRHKAARHDRGLDLAIDHLDRCPAIDLDASIDGRSCSGRFVLFEVMNIALVGPNLSLATSADPSDRCFDVVLVREFEREMFRECLEAEANGMPWPHELTTIRGRTLELASGRFPVHLDDEVYQPRRVARQAHIRLAIREGVRLLVPERDGVRAASGQLAAAS
jgi:diacylglycerol kinase (ATP)